MQIGKKIPSKQVKGQIRFYQRVLLIALILIFSSTGITADVVIFRNQKYLKGKILSQTRSTVVFRSNDGDRVTISKFKIKRILYIDDAGMDELEKQEKMKKQLRRRKVIAEQKQRALIAQRRIKEEQERQKKKREAANRLREETRRKEKERQNAARATRRGSIWRSALFPGWGQYYRGSKRRGYFIGGGTAAALFFLYRFDSTYNQKLAQFNEASDLAFLGFNSTPIALAGYLSSNSARNEMIDPAKNATMFSYLLIGLYFFNIYDVIFDDFSARSVTKIDPENIKTGKFSFGVLPDFSSGYFLQSGSRWIFSYTKNF